MSFIEDALVSQQIDAVLVDSEVTYILLANGTQVTVKGMVVVELKRQPGARLMPVIRDTQ
jgi:hypothetical protein